MSDAAPQRNLILILARNFAARLATAVFLVDAEGRVIYFNEAAERLLGQRFVEGQGMTPAEYAKLFQPTDDEGNPIPIMETPLGLAVSRGEPGHGRLRLRGADGITRPIEATAFPLLAHTDELVGVITVFWERADE
jgi:PAS domain S-box-containing protein